MPRTTIVLTGIVFGIMASASTQAADIRIGMIGLDTSHVTAFTKLLNDSAVW